MVSTYTFAAGMAFTALVTVALTYWVAGRWAIFAGGEKNSLLQAFAATSVFVFKDKELLDATPSARHLLHSAPHGREDWDRMLARLAPMFPDLPQEVEEIEAKCRVILGSAEGITPKIALNLEWMAGNMRISLYPAESEAHSSLLDIGAEIALHEELLGLRQAMNDAPLPIWKEDQEGQIQWANGAYLELILEALPEGALVPWPLPSLFASKGEGCRREILRLDGSLTHYDLIALPCLNEGQTLLYAMPSQQLFEVERNLKDFTQTMSKTFAQLPTAVAIFDANRVLQIFNPALSEITGLPVSFLVARPSFNMFLDALRDKRMIPEPKDYLAWRRQFVEMDGAAITGVYQESWSLISGQTFRVTGMPQPTGALAFLIEDVTTEIMNIRRLKAELALGQSVMDALEEAIVIIARSGEVTHCNSSAKMLFKFENLAQDGNARALTYLREITAPSSIWEEVQSFVTLFGPRQALSREVQFLNGRSYDLQVSAVYGGATLLKFTQMRCRPHLEQFDGELALISG